MHDPWNHDASRGRVFPIFLAVIGIIAAAVAAAWFTMGDQPDRHAGGSSKIERIDAWVVTAPIGPLASTPSAPAR